MTAATQGQDMDAQPVPLSLPDGITTRMVANGNGLHMHVLEAGDPEAPMLLLLHGFPELAYSWRRVMLPLAAAGYRVVAPDQRGYGRTTGWSQGYDIPLAEFGPLNFVRDAVGLVHALGRKHVHAVIGHDFGSPVAAHAALIRPDIFRAAVLMSAPFPGPPPHRADGAVGGLADPALPAALAALPRPRQHYQWYYSTPAAAPEMLADAPRFFRAYFHHKSADWPGNTPHTLPGWNAESLALLPTYYVMDLGRSMSDTVFEHMPSAAEIAACEWFTEADVAVYAAEYLRAGIQGGLNSYRSTTSGQTQRELRLFSGRSIDVPSLFISGAADWGTYQRPGDVDRMAKQACTDMRGVHLVPGAGHWVMQEQPQATLDLLLPFLQAASLR